VLNFSRAVYIFHSSTIFMRKGNNSQRCYKTLYEESEEESEDLHSDSIDLDTKDIDEKL
jgi:hypothetical protein